MQSKEDQSGIHFFNKSLYGKWSRKQKHDSDEKVIIEHGKLTVQMEVVEPPPPNFTSEFRTLRDWLINICDDNRPQKKISKYEFGLFESPANHILFLVGVNTYEESDTHTSTY